MFNILPSATTRSPASRKRMSPGTTFAEGISIFSPSLSTFASGEDKDFKLFKDFSAFSCCTVPSTAFITITARMTTVLSAFPDTMEITAAIIRMITRRSLNCSANT